MADEIASGASMLAAGAVDGNFLTRLRDIEQRLSVLEGANMQAAALGEISDDLGDVRAGRFLALTSGYEPTDADAKGVVIDAVGVEIGADTYNLVGMNNGALMFGLSATDGKAYFMGGAAVIDQSGINLTGTGNIITINGTNESGDERHATIGMENPAGGTIPALTIKSYTPSYGTTLITNGTFESDLAGSVPAHWNAPASGTFQVANSAAPFTTNFLRLENTTSFTCMAYSDTFPITPGETYYIFADIFTDLRAPDSTESSFARVYWEELDSGGGTVTSSYIFSASEVSGTEFNTGYRSIAISRVANSASSTAKIGLQIFTINGDATTYAKLWIDNICVYDLSGEDSYVIQFDPEFTVRGGATIDHLTAGTITAQAQGGTPTAPGAGYRTLYPKTDGWYDLNSGGTASRLAYASEIVSATYPEYWQGWLGNWQAYDSSGNRLSWTYNSYAANKSGMDIYLLAAAAANGWYAILNVPLRAGTYTFYMMRFGTPDSGKFDLYVGSSKITATPYDLYEDPSHYNRKWEVTGITIAADGWYQFKILNAGKNGSSRDYTLHGSYMGIDRTA